MLTNLKSDSAPGRPGQGDFPARQVNFILTYFTCPMAKDSGNEIKKYTKTYPRQAKFESCLSEGQAGIEDFFRVLQYQKCSDSQA